MRVFAARREGRENGLSGLRRTSPVFPPDAQCLSFQSDRDGKPATCRVHMENPARNLFAEHAALGLRTYSRK
jgi:hypothetical protein